jgi:mono/diheme cytochrome c family protein
MRRRFDKPIATKIEMGGLGMIRNLACVLSLVLFPFFGQEQQKPADATAATAAEAKPAVDPAVAKLVNPVKPTAVSIAAGKKAYSLDCAMCHGKAGEGDGDLAADMKLKLKDYRDPDSLKGMTDGEIYTIIEKGKGQMSGEEGRMKANQIWDVVKSLAKK